MSHGTIVPGCGATPHPWMLVGERPGETEAIRKMPFVGRAGHEQDTYLTIAGNLTTRSFYRTNVVKDYADGNPDPTPSDIERWTPTLLDEIRVVQPRFILAVGRFSARWFLEEDIDIETVNGIPCRSLRAPDAIVIPVVHPAAGFYNDDMRALSMFGYQRAVDYIKGRRTPVIVEDEYAESAEYADVSGADLEAIIESWEPDWGIAVDTEGSLTTDWHWSIQVTAEPGTGFVLRSERCDFARGIKAIAAHCRGNRRTGAMPWTYVHSAMHDFHVTRSQGLDLFDCRLWDTRYAAYITRIDPQGLKDLARRKCGMRMQSYAETIGPEDIDRQLEYLFRVSDDPQFNLPQEPRLVEENDNTTRVYTPQPIGKRALAIIEDYAADKRDKDGNPVNLRKRWAKCDYDQRIACEKLIGLFPITTLADIPLDRAIRYAGRDPDATLRVGLLQQEEFSKEYPKLYNLALEGNGVIPVFEEMQDTGMRANKQYMIEKSAKMTQHMRKVAQYISYHYFDKRPFNPGSSDQVATIMRRRGLQGEKRSKKTGKVSTGKKSIEHLRFSDDAIAHVIDWREHQKMRDSFYEPVIEIIGPDRDYARVHTDLNIYKVDSRRVSSSDPNLTAIPVRNDLGIEVRDGFIEEEGWELGSWDMSQYEMRYMAHESRDPLMVSFFNNPILDMHGETAARIFGLKLYDLPQNVAKLSKKEIEDAKAERYQYVDEMQHRYPSKRAGFGIITNIAGQGLYDQLRMFGCKGWDVEKCDALIAEYLKVYKGVGQYLEACKQEVRRNGVVYDHWGMPKYLPGVWSTDKKVAAAAERAASSHKIQGGAQGALQHAMGWLKPHIRQLSVETNGGIQWVLQIHDEIILRFRANLWDRVNPVVQDGLINHSLKLIVPVKCSGSHAPSWGQL